MADPRGALHPQVEQLFEMMRANRAARVLEPGPMREGLAALAPLLNADAPQVREREIRIPGPAGPIRARIFEPPMPGPHPALVFYHGGGYVIMSPETHAKLAKQLCVGTRAVVVSVDYRLAPEHPFPAPIDDCVAAFRWVRAHAAELGADARRVGVAGDSAGGNASAAVALVLLMAGERPPEAAALLCPWTDMTLDSESMRTFGPDDPVLDTELMRFFRDAYLKPTQASDPRASVLLADLSRFPRCLVVVGAIDPLYDDGVEFARRLEAAGGDVQLLEHEGMPHDFMLFPGIDEAQVCVDRVCAFLREALA
jgi:acetyl esterase